MLLQMTLFHCVNVCVCIYLCVCICVYVCVYIYICHIFCSPLSVGIEAASVS